MPNHHVVDLPLMSLFELVDFRVHAPWGLSHLSREEVLDAWRDGKLGATPFDPDADRAWSRREHAERVAWLWAFGWNDPIRVDVGDPSQGRAMDWPVADGNHRVMAAWMMGSKTIASVIDGPKARIQKFLGPEAVEAVEQPFFPGPKLQAATRESRSLPQRPNGRVRTGF